MMGDSMNERVWSLHCTGRPVSEIAKKTKLPEYEVRGAIVNRWAELSRDADVDGFEKGRWGE